MLTLQTAASTSDIGQRSIVRQELGAKIADQGHPYLKKEPLRQTRLLQIL